MAETALLQSQRIANQSLIHAVIPPSSTPKMAEDATSNNPSGRQVCTGHSSAVGLGAIA